MIFVILSLTLLIDVLLVGVFYGLFAIVALWHVGFCLNFNI